MLILRKACMRLVYVRPEVCHQLLLPDSSTFSACLKLALCLTRSTMELASVSIGHAMRTQVNTIS
ncbi:MAG: hypothetical protein KHX26_10420 [Burkholderiales bacterium]|nr:hypothetical protein [Burkholderiales bacterium]